MRAVQLLLLLTGLGTLRAESEFLRIRSTPEQSDCLEVAARTFAIGGGEVPVQLWLVGVSHIGTEAYYQEVQEMLAKADVVLFEGVDGNQPAFKQASSEEGRKRSTLQSNLALALGLVFQLHHIDYNQAHFINSDLTSLQLMALFDGEEMPEDTPAARAQMENLIDNMEQNGVRGEMAASVMAFLDTRPGWAKGMRWGMVNILGNVTGNITEYTGLPDHLRVLMRVLIEKRNEKVMSDIHDQLQTLAPGQTLAVFYGAAHMHDFDDRIRETYDAKLLDTTWMTAFSGNLQTSGLNLIEKKVLTWFINQQVRTLNLLSQPVGEEEVIGQ
ncbi:MAG: hypothetical protein PF795_05070 [Kiritimatiellae bacterium]|jgi:hypothetical protein|nr:hypothetical protein [Kiritimatiellia bacterium]